MPSTYDRVAEAAAFLRGQVSFRPQVAVVLGSGLGEFASSVHPGLSISYERIPHWPLPTVEGHEGRLLFGEVNGQHLAVLCGRVHFYEGFDLATVTFATRVMGTLGIKTLILTNAAGAVNPSLTAGTLMVIDDHINWMGSNPLIGSNEDRFGPRFPDMTEVYSRRLRLAADEAAARLGLELPHGVYAALSGPSYETPAEVRALRAMGADAVGMSTVPEAIVASHMGIEVLGISCITNAAPDVVSKRLDHAVVLEAVRRMQRPFVALLRGIVERHA